MFLQSDRVSVSPNEMVWLRAWSPGSKTSVVFELKLLKSCSAYWERVWQGSPGHGVSGVGVT